MRRPLALALALFAGVAYAGATASDFKKETRKGANYWNAQSTIDGDLATCWMVPGESKNVGEQLTLDVPRLAVDKIGLVVGWAKDEETFKDYSRVKAVEVTAMAYVGTELKPVGTPVMATFEDKMGMQVVDIPDIEGGEGLGGKVTLTIKEVYPGADYPNFAISEALIFLKEFDVPAKISAISTEDGGSRESMLDDNPKSSWTAPSTNASFTFTADGFSLSSVALTPTSKDYARPKRVEIKANNRTHVQELPDALGPQWIQIPAIVGYTGSAWGDIELKVLEVYPGTRHKDMVGISELKVKATNSDGL